jgi:NADPH2:quinone reductase
VFPHNAEPETFRAHAADLFDAIEKGHVEVDIGADYSLEDFAKATRAAQERLHSGAIVVTC